MTLRDAAQRLAHARLTPELVTRPVSEKRQRLEALERLRVQLDPKAPLKRGYALVSTEGHPVIASREVAARQPVLTLEFADGTIEAVPGAAKKPARKVPKAEKAAPDHGQPKLL
jgi:exodeoxyribonuclease VII large subunit